MRKLNFFLLSFLALAFVACDDDDGNGGGNNPTPKKGISENITEDTTWTSDEPVELATRVAVTNGATLTIEPGTIIKGQSGTGTNATALVIASDGKIDAEGTPEEPIIFTSTADKIQPGGGIASPNLAPDKNSLWGGVLILGNAPISAENTTISIEGIPTDDPTGNYGGNDPSHDAGTFKYVSIRHGGANIGEGNEINALSLGGIGTETTVENISVVSNQDDGIECFGGTVDVKNVLVWNQADDAFDMDQAYKGTITNGIAVLSPQSDHGFELDGPEGQSTGTYTLKNFTIKGNNSSGSANQYADLRDDVTTVMENVYFLNFPGSATFELNGNKPDEDPPVEDPTPQNYLDDNITLSNLEINTSHLNDGNTTIDKIFSVDGAQEGTFDQKPIDDAAASIVSNPEDAGADKAPFGWTWASNAGGLSDL